MYIYQEKDNIIEFQYSRVNTLSGRSRAHKGRKLLGSKKENDKYTECTLGKDLFLNYNNDLFFCSWGSFNSFLCKGDDKQLSEKLKFNVDEIKENLVNKVRKLNEKCISDEIMCIQCQNIVCNMKKQETI